MAFKITATFTGNADEKCAKEITGENPVEMFKDAPPSDYKYNSDVSLETPLHIINAVESAGGNIVKSASREEGKMFKCTTKKSALELFDKTRCVVVMKKYCAAAVRGTHNIIVSARNKCLIACASSNSIIANVGKFSRLIINKMNSIAASTGDRCTIDVAAGKSVVAITGNDNRVTAHNIHSVIGSSGDNSVIDNTTSLESIVASTGKHATIMSDQKGRGSIFAAAGTLSRIVSISSESIAIGTGIESYIESAGADSMSIVTGLGGHARATKPGSIAIAFGDDTCASGVSGAYLLLGHPRVNTAAGKFIAMYVDDKTVLSYHKYTMNCIGDIVDLDDR